MDARDVAAALRKAIALGRIAPGERAPCAAAAAIRYGVRRETAADALRELAGEGLVRDGYVADPLPDDGA